jgi:hypothetical protein
MKKNLFFFSRKKENTSGKEKKPIALPLAKKNGQEEMVGFALIVIILAVIILIFIGFAIRSPDKDAVQSYEAESFVQSTLQHTTDCRDNLEFLTIQKLIFRCNEEAECLDDRETCDVLKQTLQDLVEESWKVENRPLEGYELKIMVENTELLNLNQGNKTRNYKGAVQDFSKGGNSVVLLLNIYS